MVTGGFLPRDTTKMIPSAFYLRSDIILDLESDSEWESSLAGLLDAADEQEERGGRVRFWRE